MIIKFSHYYKKLINLGMHNEISYPCKVTLLDVIPVNLEDLSKEFKDYDTDYGAYKLPAKGKYLMLIFRKSDNDIFTTLRAVYSSKGLDKVKYYRDAIGKEFDVEYAETTNG